jgi:DNA-binding XRE family transcriptional regulator
LICRQRAREIVCATMPHLSSLQRKREVARLLHIQRKRAPFSQRKVPLPDEEVARILRENKDQPLSGVAEILHRVSHAKGMPITKQWVHVLYRQHGIVRTAAFARALRRQRQAALVRSRIRSMPSKQVPAALRRKPTYRLGQNIRQFRKVRGWTQTELARRIGINLRYLQKIEREAMNVSFKVLLQAKRVFQCEWDDLFRAIS